jgi:hypothetical protein
MLVVQLKTKKKKIKVKIVKNPNTVSGFSNGIEKKKLKKKLPQR